MAIQLGSVLLDACVLAVVMREDTYGYKLTQEVKQIMDVSESTLYPVLRRLQQSGCLTVYDKPFQGRNRRYYAITPAGRAHLQEMLATYHQFFQGVNDILAGKEDP